MNSKYFMPTRVIMGHDCIVNNSEVFSALGTCALIVTGAHSAKANGSEKDVTDALEKAEIRYFIYDKVMSNPTVSCVYEGAALARENKVDFIIAIGGGSPMDAGKAISMLAAQNIDEENLFSGKYGKKILPMAFVPTTAGTGAEVTQYSILTNDKKQTKTSIAAEMLFPTVAFLDEKYMENLSAETTVNTVTDALSHAVEGMMSVKASVITDSLAEASIRMISLSLPEILDFLSGKRDTLQASTREQLLHASCMAGMVIAQTGTTAVHAMGYSLTYFKKIDHGKANGLLLGEFLRFTQKSKPELIAKILTIMDLSSVDQFVDLMDVLLGDKGNICFEEMQSYSKKAMLTGNILNCAARPEEEDLLQIYKASFLHK
jgi:alcohol dehydrogenase class IV